MLPILEMHTTCMIHEMVGISKWDEALYSLTGTQKQLMWLDICPLLFLPFHHLDEYI